MFHRGVVKTVSLIEGAIFCDVVIDGQLESRLPVWCPARVGLDLQPGDTAMVVELDSGGDRIALPLHMIATAVRPEIRVAAGVEYWVHDGAVPPAPLALKSDVAEIWAYLASQFDPSTGHVHATPSGPTTTIANADTIGEETGTVVLMAR